MTSTVSPPRTPQSSPPSDSPPPPQSLIYLSFNQDHGCFAAGTTSGFRVYTCHPLKEEFHRNFTDGGAAVVQLLFRYNLIPLVKQQSPKTVMIWNEHQSRCMAELSFRSEVMSVRLRRDRIVVILQQTIHVYNFEDLRLLDQIETDSNPKGLCEVSHVSGESMILACPGLLKGQVRVEHYGPKRTRFITAHDSRLAAFALTNDGRFLATSSSKGTLIRVFSTHDGSLLQELRRGADRADIYSIAFSRSAQWLAVSGDKGTVHVFRLNVVDDDDSARASSSQNLSYIRSRVLPRYFSSEWSVARFRLVQGLQTVVGFGKQDNTVVILGMDGSYYQCEFDPVAGGEMMMLEHHNILKPEESF